MPPAESGVMRAAISHPGFDFSVPSEVRARLLAGRAEHLLLETLLAHCSARGWLKARGSTSGRERGDPGRVAPVRGGGADEPEG